MEGAGKTIDDEELRAAMQEKDLARPPHPPLAIEDLIAEKVHAAVKTAS
jgi:DNA topoisomerase-3